jgi:antitoxin ParD1/3/4
MNIEIKPELEKLIQKHLTSGEYTSTENLIEAALHLLEQRNQYNVWVEEVRQKIDLAAEQLDRGEGVDGETAIAELRKQLHRRKKADA